MGETGAEKVVLAVYVVEKIAVDAVGVAVLTAADDADADAAGIDVAQELVEEEVEEAR